MKYFLYGALFLLISCGSQKKTENKISENSPRTTADFTIAFGSCNKADVPNLLWDDILSQNPDIWIWGGDNVYADTDNMQKMKAHYDAQKAVENYKKLAETVEVHGTWDDHDYGVNDGGVEFHAKKESQKELLDFFGVPENDVRRTREGVYYHKDFNHAKGSLRLIVLDTRYFRTSLTDDTETKKRYRPNVYGEGTLLGKAQWEWLEKVLRSSKADFNVIVSSIQVLSHEHGYETWGNFPHEVDKLMEIIESSKARGVMALSGDRHISDFSKTSLKKKKYPFIDFTSSGLTHAATNNKGEPNKYRVGALVNQISYGLLRFYYSSGEVVMEMRGDDGVVQQSLKQSY